MVKSRPLEERTWYEWYDGVISHMSEFVKKSVSDAKQKMKLFEAKIDNNKPKKIAGAFEDDHIKYKSEVVETRSMQQYLESIRP